MTARDTEQGGLTQIAKAISEYLSRNPKAADTIEGISQWWLPKDEKRSTNDILCALEKLIAQGRVEKHISPCGRCLFRRRHDA